MSSVRCPACGSAVPIQAVDPLQALGRLTCGLDGEHSWAVIDTATWEDRFAPEPDTPDTMSDHDGCQ